MLEHLCKNLGFEFIKLSPKTSPNERLKRLYQHNQIDLLLDVGANCGQYALMMRKLGYKGKIVSFDPIQECHEALLKKSQKDANWKIHERCALGSAEGQADIFVSKNLVSSSLKKIKDLHIQHAPDSEVIRSEKVPVYTLDQVVPQYIHDYSSKNIFLKLDTQGFEIDILNGANKILPQIQGLQIEMSLVDLYDDQILFDEMLGIIKNLGFELHTLITGFTDYITGRTLQVDGVFFKTKKL